MPCGCAICKYTLVIANRLFDNFIGGFYWHAFRCSDTVKLLILCKNKQKHIDTSGQKRNNNPAGCKLPVTLPQGTEFFSPSKKVLFNASTWIFDPKDCRFSSNRQVSFVPWFLLRQVSLDLWWTEKVTDLCGAPVTSFIISLLFMYGPYQQAASMSETLPSLRCEVLTATLVQVSRFQRC